MTVYVNTDFSVKRPKFQDKDVLDHCRMVFARPRQKIATGIMLIVRNGGEYFNVVRDGAWKVEDNSIRWEHGYRRENFSIKCQAVEDGDVFEDCMLAQREPHTVLPELKGKRVAFVGGGNLMNVEIDPAWDMSKFTGLHVHKDIEPPPEPLTEAEMAVETVGADALLDVIGKEAAQAKWGLTDSKVVP